MRLYLYKLQCMRGCQKILHFLLGPRDLVRPLWIHATSFGLQLV